MKRLVPVLCVFALLAGCGGEDTQDIKLQTVTLRCSESNKSRNTSTASYSFTMGDMPSGDRDADINFYFDGDDCSQGALYGQGHRVKDLFPLGKEPWSELSLSNPPPSNAGFISSIKPINKDKEGLAFWVKTKSSRYALVRIKSVKPASYSDFASGDTAEIVLEWAWETSSDKQED